MTDPAAITEEKNMKKVLVPLLIIAVTLFIFLYMLPDRPIILGDTASPFTWVYLSGIVGKFKYEAHNRDILDTIGKELHLKIVAIPPQERSADFNNMLHWPFDTDAELTTTYNYILKQLGNQKVSGYIGFSNGGYFLTSLAQQTELDAPVIAVGAGGYLRDKRITPTGPITIIIGTQDEHNYSPAIDFVKSAQEANIPIKLIEHDGGHEIPPDMLKQVLAELQ